MNRTVEGTVMTTTTHNGTLRSRMAGAAGVIAICVVSVWPIGGAVAQSPPSMPTQLPIPNDKYFGEQWGLYNFAQPVAGGKMQGVKNADMHVPEAWTITKGSPDVIVAVVDTGAALEHPDLKPNIWTNPGESGTDAQGREKKSNGVDDDANGFVDDWRGWDFVDNDNDPSGLLGGSAEDGLPLEHGTAVTSVIAAVADNQIGVAGVAPNVKVMVVRAGRGGGGLGFSASRAASAMDYAAKMGASVVNLSYGGPPLLNDGRDEKEVISRYPNVLFVPGAGNNGTSNDQLGFIPCTHDLPNILCVAGTGAADELALWGEAATTTEKGSNWGARVHVAAPSFGILVAQPARKTIFKEDFENGVDAWTVDGTWALTDTDAHGGRRAVVSAPAGSAARVKATMTLRQYPDLSRYSNCIATMWVKADDIGAGTFQVETDVVSGTFGFRAGDLQVTKASLTLVGKGWQQWTVNLNASASRRNLNPRLAYESFQAEAGRGALVDDFEIQCATDDFSGSDYAYTYGTSFAAPMSSGVAALVKSKYPVLTGVQIKQAIMAGVDQVPGLAGKVATGGRVNAWKALIAAGDIAAGKTVAVPTSAPTTTTTRPAAGASTTTSVVTAPTSTAAAATTVKPAGGILKWLLPSIGPTPSATRGGVAPSNSDSSAAPAPASGESGEPQGDQPATEEGDDTFPGLGEALATTTLAAVIGAGAGYRSLRPDDERDRRAHEKYLEAVKEAYPDSIGQQLSDAADAVGSAAASAASSFGDLLRRTAIVGGVLAGAAVGGGIGFVGGALLGGAAGGPEGAFFGSIGGALLGAVVGGVKTGEALSRYW